MSHFSLPHTEAGHLQETHSSETSGEHGAVELGEGSEGDDCESACSGCVAVAPASAHTPPAYMIGVNRCVHLMHTMNQLLDTRALYGPIQSVLKTAHLSVVYYILCKLCMTHAMQID